MIKLDKHEREALEQLQRAYLESTVELLCDAALRDRESLDFNTIYELSSLKKQQIVRLLQNDTDFHIDLRFMIQQTNDIIASL